ncbi:hypothetical protein ColKHC_14247 [Colletotrichum higginsianum]|nr:hypothetical protein ColKHC_14247 [Colletotrichum higginsianum]
MTAADGGAVDDENGTSEYAAPASGIMSRFAGSSNWLSTGGSSPKVTAGLRAPTESIWMDHDDTDG